MLNLGFGTMIGFTILMLVYFKFFANDIIVKNTFEISIYNGFLCTGAYINVAITSILKKCKNYEIISECVPIIVYASIFIFLNYLFNFIFKSNHISNEVRTASYRSMLFLQIVCILFFKWYDILPIMLSFYLGEVLSVQLKGVKNKPKSPIYQKDKEKTKREIRISRYLNVILSLFILLDYKAARFSIKLILIGLIVGLILAFIYLLLYYYIINYKKTHSSLYQQRNNRL